MAKVDNAGAYCRLARMDALTASFIFAVYCGYCLLTKFELRNLSRNYRYSQLLLTERRYVVLLRRLIVPMITDTSPYAWRL